MNEMEEVVPVEEEMRTARRQVAVATADNRPALARQVSGSASVRINAVDDTVDLVRVNAVSYVLLSAVNLSLVVAGIVVLVRHWDDDEVCDEDWRTGWRWWVLTLTARKVVTTPAHMVRWRLSLQQPEERDEALDRRSECVLKWMDNIALLYFMIGHVYIFRNLSCDNKLDWPVFQLAVAILVIKWMRYLLPCLMCCVLVPATICCMPCFLWLLAWLNIQQEPSAGAQQDEIDSISTVKFSEMENMTDESCCICLVDYEADDSLRKLPCGHAFHVSCADSWLAMNATCPVCRAPCFEAAGGGEGVVDPNTGTAPTLANESLSGINSRWTSEV